MTYDGSNGDAAYNYGAMLGLRKSLNQANENQRNLKAHIEVLQAEVAVLKSVEAGRLAQIEAWKKMYPDSPLLADSGIRFADGDKKSKIRLIFEQAFDTMAKKLGISDPVKRRQN